MQGIDGALSGPAGSSVNDLQALHQQSHKTMREDSGNDPPLGANKARKKTPPDAKQPGTMKAPAKPRKPSSAASVAQKKYMERKKVHFNHSILSSLSAALKRLSRTNMNCIGLPFSASAPFFEMQPWLPHRCLAYKVGLSF